jgi:drug/metabolite transporter (DMT)-like permease
MVSGVILGLALALACAVATSVAFLLKHRGAVLAPPVRVRHPLRSAAELFRSKWFAVGWLVAVGAWVLHVGALALAPLSIVQAVLSAGLVFLAVIAERFFGFRLGRRQWIGVIITAAGLAVIGLTQETPPGERPGYALAALIAVECTVFALAIALTRISSRRGIGDAWQGIILGGIAGALFGVSDIALARGAGGGPGRRQVRHGANAAKSAGSHSGCRSRDSRTDDTANLPQRQTNRAPYRFDP